MKILVNLTEMTLNINNRDRRFNHTCFIDLTNFYLIISYIIIKIIFYKYK